MSLDALTQADRAVVHKLAWRSGTTSRYATALVRAGLRCRQRGIGHFNNDDVPEASQPNDGTTVGSVVRLLCAERVIEPCRITLAADGIYGGMRRSTRPCNNGHRNQLYTLVSTGRANAWLLANGTDPEPVQQELF